MGLWYPKDFGFELTAFSDVDHVGCIDTHKSISGGIQFLGDKFVSWMSKKQDCTAMSSVEAEYVALSTSYAQVMWMRTQLKDYGFNYNKIPLYCDSQSAIAISCNPVQHSRTKHIHTRYHFIKEQVKNGRLRLTFELTLDQSQQGVSNDVLVSINGVEELKRNVMEKGLKKEAPPPQLRHEESGVNTYAVESQLTNGNPAWANIKQALGRIHKDGDGDASFQLKSNSSPHAHAQTTKTYYKHQDSRIMKAQELKTKTSAQTLILKITLRRNQALGTVSNAFK
ncbi:hypothetical protein Tco_0533710 [Tanacetum coccineum]